MKQFILYALRWQLSTPILAPLTGGLSWESFKNATVANLVGSCIFFFVDKWIFKRRDIVENKNQRMG